MNKSQKTVAPAINKDDKSRFIFQDAGDETTALTLLANTTGSVVIVPNGHGVRLYRAACQEMSNYLEKIFGDRYPQENTHTVVQTLAQNNNSDSLYSVSLPLAMYDCRTKIERYFA